MPVVEPLSIRQLRHQTLVSSAVVVVDSEVVEGVEPPIPAPARQKMQLPVLPKNNGAR